MFEPIKPFRADPIEYRGQLNLTLRFSLDYVAFAIVTEDIATAIRRFRYCTGHAVDLGTP